MTAYFVKNGGSDAAAGTSDGTAWETLAKVQSSTGVSDSISLNKGDEWREDLAIPASSQTYHAYGTGDNPIVNGADDITAGSFAWTASGSGTNEFYLSLADAGTALDMPGESGDYASTPDSAALSVTGDLDLRIDVAMDDWTPVGNAALVCKWAAGSNDRSYLLQLLSGGGLQFLWSIDGISSGSVAAGAAPAGVTDGSRTWLRVTVDVDDGGGNRVFHFYQSTNGSTWVEIGSGTTTAGTISFDDNASVLEVGSFNAGTGSPLPGQVFRAQVYDGIGGTLVFDAQFDQETSGTTSFTESSAQAATVTVNQSGSPQAEIVDVTTAGITEPNQLFLDDTRLVVGTMGSLSDHEWDWGNNDGLSFNTVYVRDNTGDPDTSGAQIEASQRARCFVMAADTGTTISNIQFEKGNNAIGGGIYMEGGVAGTEIDTCTFHDHYGSAVHYFDGSTSSGAVHVHDSFFFNSGSSALAMADNAIGWTVEYNELDSNCRDTSNNFTSAINATETATATAHTIQNNHIHNDTFGAVAGGTDRDGGIWVDGVSNPSIALNNIIRYNLVRDMNYQGIRVEIARSCQVYYNIVIDCVHHGIAVARYVNDNLVYNNVVYGCLNGINVRGEDGQASSCVDNLVKNNIAVGSTESNLMCFYGGENDGTVGSGNVYMYNCFGAESTDFIEWVLTTNYATYDLWEEAYEASNSVEEDPLFDNAGGSTAVDYRLQAGSPCENAGLNVGLTTDFSGASVRDPPEIGAFELTRGGGNAFAFVRSRRTREDQDKRKRRRAVF